MQDEILRLIKDVPFFVGVSPGKLQELVAHAQLKHFNRNTIIVNEGDPTTKCFYLLISGRVRVFISDRQGLGRELTLTNLGPGSYFGELSLLDDDPRSASIMAVDRAQCAMIRREDFIAWLSANHPDVALAVIRDLTHRIRFLTRHAGRLALADVYSRLTDLLIELSEEGDEGLRVVRVRPKRQELANMIGASREMVTRIIRDLIEGKYILEEGKELRILRQFPRYY